VGKDAIMAIKITKVGDAQPEGFVGKRGLAQLGARATESLLGLPGDIANLGLGAANWGIQKLTGEPSPLPGKVPLLQTSEDIRQKVTEPISELLGGSKEYIAPQSPTEEFLGELISDFSTLALPVKGKIPFAKAATIAGAGALGGKAGELIGSVFGGQETGKTVGKIGGMVTASLLGGRNMLRNRMRQDYQTAREMASNDLIDVRPLRHKTTKLIADISKRDFPNKDFVLDRLNTLDQVVGLKDKVPVGELTNLKADLNEWYPRSYGKTKHYLDQIIRDIKEPISNYEKQNPAFGTAWRNAEDTYKAMAESRGIRSFFESNPKIQEKISNPTLKALLSGGAGVGLVGSALTKGVLPTGATAAGLGAAALGTDQIVKFLQLISKNPAARKTYSDMLKNATLFNVSKVSRDAQKLDNILNKEEMPTEGLKLRITKVGA